MLVLLCWASVAFGYREQKYPDENSPHFLYLPDRLDPAVTYWVVVGVHPANWNNRGAGGMARWADSKPNVMVLGPRFSKTYQNADKEDQDLLIGLFKSLQKEYKIHPTMFLYGFSGGAQFAHRFAMKQPDYVCGVSSHSGGSWGTDQYGKINDAAKHIPFAISCGEKDTGKAWAGAPYGRLDWFKRFRDIIAEKGFFYRAATWPNAGHGADPGVHEMTEECFQLATTGFPPSSGLGEELARAKKLAADGELDKAQRLILELGRANVKLPEESGWHDNREALALRKALVKKALAGIDTSPRKPRRLAFGKMELLNRNLLSTLVRLSDDGLLEPKIIPLSISITRAKVALTAANADGTLTFRASSGKTAPIDMKRLRAADLVNLAILVTELQPENREAQAMAGVYLESLGRVTAADKFFARAGPEARAKLEEFFE